MLFKESILHIFNIQLILFITTAVSSVTQVTKILWINIAFTM